MYKLICTSYNKEENKLVLRNNWTEEVENENHLMEILKKWKIKNDFKYPSKNSISEILEGEMNVPNIVIHVRILKFN